MFQNIKKSEKGFTLIELLVVVAIIGILSAVVLTSLGTARKKAKEASAKSQMSSLRAEAELYSLDNGDSYTGFCTSGIEIAGGLLFESGADVGGAVDCEANATTWAALVVLETGTSFCVDSTGTAATTAATTVTTAAGLISC